MLFAFLTLGIGILRRAWVRPVLFFVMILLSVSLASDMMALSPKTFGLSSTIGIIHIYGFIELALLTLIFQAIVPAQRIWIVLVGTLTFLYLLRTSLFVTGFHQMPQNNDVAISIFGVVGSLVAYLYLYQKEETRALYTLTDFWVLTGLLIYFGGSIIVFTLSAKIIDDSDNSISGLWAIHNAMLMTRNLFMAIGFTRLSEKTS